MIHLLIILSLIVVDAAIFIVLLMHILLRRRGTSETRLAWVVFIILIPYLGALAYLLVGGIYFGRVRHHRHISLHANNAPNEQPDLEDLPGMEPRTPSPYRRVFTLAENLCPSDLLGGNHLDLEIDSENFLKPLLEDIENATRNVHLLTYIYLADDTGRQVASALRAAAKRGVHCRVLVDSMGSRDFLRSDLSREMEADGVQVVEALPASLFRITIARIDLRNHRKIVVIDNKIGYVGSQNIADPSFAPKAKFAPWVDCMVRINGPAVHDLQELFLEDWFLETGETVEGLYEELPHVQQDGADVQIIASGPNLDHGSFTMVLQSCFHVASEEIILTTPYFVPDVATETALIAAARRGVATTLILPARNDSRLVSLASRSHYEDILRAGVRIYHFNAGLLHAKTLTVDRQLFMLGSANLDRRSMELNFEVNMLGWNPDFAGQLRLLQLSYQNDSTEIKGQEWLNAGWKRRLARNAAGMLSPLL
ncbi:MAG: cardiolipin synthase [Phycisphaerales bacterium]|nr:cardiolipin synthase [Phycisphaerales bacterium]